MYVIHRSLAQPPLQVLKHNQQQMLVKCRFRIPSTGRDSGSETQESYLHMTPPST
jgi:hypothetical protein